MYVLQNNRWSKILIGRDVLLNLAITPEHVLVVQKQKVDLETKLAASQNWQHRTVTITFDGVGSSK